MQTSVKRRQCIKVDTIRLMQCSYPQICIIIVQMPYLLFTPYHIM